MRVLFYLGHPAHFHLFKHAIHHFGDRAIVIIKSKDVLEELLTDAQISFISVEENIKKSNTGSKMALAFRMLKRSMKIVSIIRKEKPAILVGSPAELAVISKFMSIPVYMFFEDDVEKVAPYGSITGPTATGLVCPDVCSAGKWSGKKIGYNSYHELAYLHPDHFIPDRKKVQSIFKQGERNFIIRFVELGAFHDKGRSGISNELAKSIIEKLLPHGKVHITSERTLPSQFEQYRINLSPTVIHHALNFADMYIGDSQTMTAEASVLGTPALRFNDFVGELSYLEDLEHRYHLTFGFKTQNPQELLTKIDELLGEPDLRNIWNSRRNVMLNDKLNLANWMIEFIDKKLRNH